jgi:PAS domain S-box-containing protein
MLEPADLDALFDGLPDVVFFVKNRRGEYTAVSQTLVERLRKRSKEELLGRRVDEVFPAPLGRSYRAQDEQVLEGGEPIRNQLELHFYPGGRRGWCVTQKLPLRAPGGEITGLVGISRDLQAAHERSADFSQVAQAVRIIQTRYDEPLRVRELARRAGLSAYQFDQRMRRIFRIGAGQLIQKVRMEAALARLRESEESIAAIASACGYADQSAFTRAFRQTVGFSPSEYRASPKKGS